ncbi:MAG: ComEA family DNA-binding protein [Janthinobacterium lividum]
MNLRRLFPSIALLVAAPLLFAQMPAGKAAKPVPVTKAVTGSTAQGDLLDINTATPDQLMKLPGIGDAYAKRIIGGRPYTAKNQLSTRGILPNGTYEKIAGQIIAKRSK